MASRAVSVSKGQPWKTRMESRGQFAVMAMIPSSVTFRQWLTFSSLKTFEQAPCDKATNPVVVT